MLSWILFSGNESAKADSIHAAADTLAHSSEKFDFAELLHHVYDGPELELPFLGHVHLPHLNFYGIDFSITKHIIFLWLAAILLVVGLTIVARKNTKNRIPKGLGNLVEIIILFIRDEIVVPNMGTGGLKYLPYILTNFFFILVMNLLGMFPYGASATGNVNITAGLAIIAFVMIQYSAIRAQGFGHYLAHLTGGTHWTMWFIMIPIEFLGLFIKPFALCIRLFANMTAGHIVILAIIGLIFIFQHAGVGIVSVPLAVAVNMLELFVALIQAYIFTMLTSIFMGLGMQTEEHSSEHH